MHRFIVGILCDSYLIITLMRKIQYYLHFGSKKENIEVITRICEINYCKELREHLIGNLPLEVIVEYIDNIKKLPDLILKNQKN